MKFTKTALAAIAIACAAPVSAADNVLPSATDAISKYRDAGAWSIYQNETRGTCFGSYKSKQGAIVQFGFTKAEDMGYLGLFSQGGPETDDDQSVAVIANGNLYSGTATGTGAALQDGYTGGYMLVNNPQFVKDVEIGQELVAFPETPQSYIVDMRGAKNAVYEVRECTKKLADK